LAFEEEAAAGDPLRPKADSTGRGSKKKKKATDRIKFIIFVRSDR